MNFRVNVQQQNKDGKREAPPAEESSASGKVAIPAPPLTEAEVELFVRICELALVETAAVLADDVQRSQRPQSALCHVAIDAYRCASSVLTFVDSFGINALRENLNRGVEPGRSLSIEGTRRVIRAAVERLSDKFPFSKFLG